MPDPTPAEMTALIDIAKKLGNLKALLARLPKRRPRWIILSPSFAVCWRRGFRWIGYRVFRTPQVTMTLLWLWWLCVSIRRPCMETTHAD